MLGMGPDSVNAAPGCELARLAVDRASIEVDICPIRDASFPISRPALRR